MKRRRSSTWKQRRHERDQRIEQLKNRYVRRLRGEPEDGPSRRGRRILAVGLLVVVAGAAFVVGPRLFGPGDEPDVAEPGSIAQARERAAEVIEERTTELVSEVEERLDVSLTADDEPLRAPDSTSTAGWALPLANISAERAARPHHTYPAWDYGTAVGTEVYAMVDGRIAWASADDGDRCGGGVRIDSSADGAQFTYCHLSAVDVEAGDVVTAGDPLGRTGGQPGAPGAGRSSGPHLHLQIRLDGQLRCPQAQLLALSEGRPLETADLPVDCFYTRSGLPGLDDYPDADPSDPWFEWD